MRVRARSGSRDLGSGHEYRKVRARFAPARKALIRNGKRLAPGGPNDWNSYIRPDASVLVSDTSVNGSLRCRISGQWLTVARTPLYARHRTRPGALHLWPQSEQDARGAMRLSGTHGAIRALFAVGAGPSEGLPRSGPFVHARGVAAPSAAANRSRSPIGARHCGPRQTQAWAAVPTGLASAGGTPATSAGSCPTHAPGR